MSLPDSVTDIGNKAFYNCINLQSIPLSDSVVSIGNAAFEDCAGLVICAPAGNFAERYAKENGIACAAQQEGLTESVYNSA